MITARYQKNNDLTQLKKIGIDKWHWQFIIDSHYTKAVVLENGIIIGVAAFSITLGTANLDFIFVQKNKRSQGAGDLLLRKTEQWAKNKKANGLGVNCSEKNVSATDFYLRKGFKQTGKVHNYFSNNQNQLFFWKKVQNTKIKN